MLAADSSTPEHVRLAGVEMKAVQPVALLPADVDIVYAHPKSCIRPLVCWRHLRIVRVKMRMEAMFFDQRDQICTI